MNFTHYNPVAVTFGPNLLAGVAPACRGRTLIVTGRQTLERAGCLSLLDENLKRSSPVPSNPGDSDIDRLLSEARDHRVETVVGFGGGSAMDAAKVVAMLVYNWPTVAEYRSRVHSQPRRVYLIQVPTTAGTGSEVTRWASLWNAGVKSSIDEAQGFADLALVDPRLCQGMPRRLSLATGMDALSHAMESLWGVHKTVISEGYAVRALLLLSDHLPAACEGSSNDATWEALALASMLAGLALSCTRSAAAHALSYELTGRFGLEHGLAVGLLCKSLLRWNEPAAPEGVATIASAMGLEDRQAVQDFIDDCFAKAGLRPNLSSFGITADRFSEVIEQACESPRLGNNPVGFDRQTLLAVLETIA